MVSPKADGSPGYDRYCEMLLEAYERDGAVRGEDGEVELPEEMWAEFEANYGNTGGQIELTSRQLCDLS